MYVYNKIIENSKMFTYEELKHANKYINLVRNRWGKGKLILDLPNNFPQVRPEINPKRVLK